MENKEKKILCPECFKGRVISKDNKIGGEGKCDKCGTKFIITGPQSVRYL